MITIFNPNYVAPVDAAAARIRAKLDAYFLANPGVKSVRLEQLKNAFPGDASDMNPGWMYELAKKAGWAVEVDK